MKIWYSSNPFSGSYDWVHIQPSKSKSSKRFEVSGRGMYDALQYAYDLGVQEERARLLRAKPA